MNVFPNLGNSWSTCYLHDMVNVKLTLSTRFLARTVSRKIRIDKFVLKNFKKVRVGEDKTIKYGMSNFNVEILNRISKLEPIKLLK